VEWFFRIEPHQIDGIARRYGPLQPDPDPVLHAAWGEDYETRWDRYRAALQPAVVAPDPDREFREIAALISELIEHSGRAHRRRGSYAAQRTNQGKGCMAAVVFIVVLAVIGAIAGACGSGAQPAGHTASAGLAPTVSGSPTAAASTAAHHARHHHRRRHRHPHRPAAVPVATQSAPSAPSCAPLSNEGTCYEPGEFCRHSDEGATGVAGDGERIKCEDNNGWRWEPI
jgi:hypothetical protein